MLDWVETLQGPRSLVTGNDGALVTLEDPGLIELRGKARDRTFAKGVRQALGMGLPGKPWASSAEGELCLLWRGPERWWALMPRDMVAGRLAMLEDGIGKRAVASDMTGAFAALRLVGIGVLEALIRCCPLDLSQIGAGEARGTSVHGIPVTLLRETSDISAWLVLAPRSLAEAVARELAAPLSTTDRLGLFGVRDIPV